MAVKECCVVVHSNYIDGLDAEVFLSKNDARKSVQEDAVAVAASLKEQGYNRVEALERLDSCEIYVPDSGIYYEWSLVESKIVWGDTD